MNNLIRWCSPFHDCFGNGMVYRLFAVGRTLYAVGFEEIMSMSDFTQKDINILKAYPEFRFPGSGVWGVVFDEIAPFNSDFKGFQHVQHSGIAGGRVLYNVASIIFEHYTVCNAGAYVFSAAHDSRQIRRTDLIDIYSRALGIDGYPQSRLFSTLFNGWQAFSDVATGGRGYVITTESY
jgi:hypothetical protein